MFDLSFLKWLFFCFVFVLFCFVFFRLYLIGLFDLTKSFVGVFFGPGEKEFV